MISVATSHKHHNNRLRALEAVRLENATLTRLLFDTYASEKKSQNTSRDLLSLLEKQDRNLEEQLAQVQQYVMDQRAVLEETKLAFEDHLATHGRAFDGHQETLSSISRLASLEDKKHASLTSRGLAEHASTSVKEKINAMRRERLLFENLTKKYKKELIKIGGEVLRAMKECMERVEQSKKRKACVARLKEVARAEEAAWASGWREQITRMEAFTEREGRSQRVRMEEKRARVIELLRGGRGASDGRDGREAYTKEKVMDQPEKNNEIRSAMAQVMAHVFGNEGHGRGQMEGVDEPPHVAIAWAFEVARAEGVARYKREELDKKKPGRRGKASGLPSPAVLLDIDAENDPGLRELEDVPNGEGSGQCVNVVNAVNEGANIDEL